MKPTQLKPGHGTVAKVGGRTLALFNDHGKIKAASASCTHKGCTVAWNDADATFDCPCHGSRFNPDFTVHHGPAAKPLEPAKIDE